MKNDRDVSCRAVMKQLYDYLDGELEPQALDAIQAHLASCESCAEGTAFEAHVLSGLKVHLRRVTAPAELRARVDSILKAWQGDGLEG